MNVNYYSHIFGCYNYYICGISKKQYDIIISTLEDLKLNKNLNYFVFYFDIKY